MNTNDTINNDNTDNNNNDSSPFMCVLCVRCIGVECLLYGMKHVYKYTVHIYNVVI